MARYTGPKVKLSRKFGEDIFGNTNKRMNGRNPGNGRRRKSSEYGVMLAEKQKAKYTYGVLEKQFRILFDKAAAASGITGEILLQSLECRLDNVVYRLGIATTRAAARQLVNHKHITVDGKVVNIAFAVSAAFVFGDHLGFTAGFAPDMLPAMIVGKLVGGVSAVAVALWLTRKDA